MKPGPTALDDVAIRAFVYFAEHCEEGGHVMCNYDGSCEQALDNAIQRARFDLMARQFDLARLVIPPASEPPKHTWPTSVLFRVVKQTLIDEPAWSKSAHRRTVWLTSALARLGERGIPADAVVRTYFGTRIRRQMVIEIVGAYTAVATGRVTFNEIPRTLRDWFPLVPEGGNRDELLAHCLAGPLSDTIEDQIQHGAIVHVIGWRRHAERVEVAPEDRVVEGGLDATRWLIDRFTRTALDEWFRSSLDWELANLSDSEATARTAGVPAVLVAERPVSESMVVEAIGRRTREPSLGDEVFGGMAPVELLDNVIALTLRDERSAALELIRKAVEVSPARLEFEQALAFLLIPDSPTEAERRLLSMRGRRGAPEELLTACLAICKLREGHVSEMLASVGDLARSSDLRRYWLWTAESLAGAELDLYQTSLPEWATNVLSKFSR